MPFLFIIHFPIVSSCIRDPSIRTCYFPLPRSETRIDFPPEMRHNFSSLNRDMTDDTPMRWHLSQMHSPPHPPTLFHSAFYCQINRVVQQPETHPKRIIFMYSGNCMLCSEITKSTADAGGMNCPKLNSVYVLDQGHL